MIKKEDIKIETYPVYEDLILIRRDVVAKLKVSSGISFHVSDQRTEEDAERILRRNIEKCIYEDANQVLRDLEGNLKKYCADFRIFEKDLNKLKSCLKIN